MCGRYSAGRVFRRSPIAEGCSARRLAAYFSALFCRIYSEIAMYTRRCGTCGALAGRPASGCDRGSGSGASLSCCLQPGRRTAGFAIVRSVFRGVGRSCEGTTGETYDRNRVAFAGSTLRAPGLRQKRTQASGFARGPTPRKTERTIANPENYAAGGAGRFYTSPATDRLPS